MIHAYDEIYLDDAMETLGSAVEYATLLCKVDGQAFLNFFVASGLAKEFGRGNVRYISGMSGIELARLVLETCGKDPGEIMELPYIDYPSEYWVGWILAYYQWHTGKSFATILRRISYESLDRLYGVLHEADPQKAIEVFNKLMAGNGETNLARLRKNSGVSQSQLANAANVSVRFIQLYEQRQTDINNAKYHHLWAIARVLRCTVEELLE